MTDEQRTPKQRREYGRSLRDTAPRSSHADWSADPDRADPVELIENQNEDRVEWLVPVRRTRMAASPFAFFRGSARIMAHDLAATPVSGLDSQICGDAHLANFGGYASPERRLVFDINDFDETLPGPWEWDVKRLAASFTIAGRHNGLGKRETRKVTQRAVRMYRDAMARLARMRVTDMWYDLVDAKRVLGRVEDKKVRRGAAALFQKAMSKDSRQALVKLAEEVDGEYRIRSEPPLLIPLRDLAGEFRGGDLRETTHQVFDDYLRTAPHHVAHLLQKFRLVDVALKVVGVGSVGTRCFTLLLVGRDTADPLFLQVKQAGRSVLEEHLRKSRYKVSGQRVVEGQRLMQTVSDIFLGWAKAAVSGHHYYVRQLKDWKVSSDVEHTSYKKLYTSAGIRGWTLARAHARTGDPIAISGYLGSGDRFARAVTEFAERYADQNELDHRAFVAGIDDGRLEAAEFE